MKCKKIVDEGDSQDASSSGAPRMVLYSGHDNTIMPLLVAYGVEPSSWAPYASTVILELYEYPTTKEWAVRMVFNGMVLHPPMCESKSQELCDFRKFLTYSKTLLPADPWAECHMHHFNGKKKRGLRFSGEEEEPDERMTEYPIALLVVVVVLSVAIVLLGICLLRKEIQMQGLKKQGRFSYHDVADQQRSEEAILEQQALLGSDSTEAETWRRMSAEEQRRWEDAQLMKADRFSCDWKADCNSPQRKITRKAAVVPQDEDPEDGPAPRVAGGK